MSNIDFEALLQMYETQLCNRVFCYEIANGQTVCVGFYREQLCHLMGLQHIFGRDRRYLGASGFEKIKQGRLTVQHAKRHDRPAFDQIKERLLYFSELPTLMLQGDMMQFRADAARTSIIADFIIYREKRAHLLHLFLRKESEKKDYYAPVSFVVKTLNDRQPQQYIDGQKYMKINSRYVIPMV